MPDRITIYRLPILERCRTEAEVVTQVRITVVHEIAHHFGISDARLHELGWG
jgi:predicted Zn-dependent protease with MMP-like domain